MANTSIDLTSLDFDDLKQSFKNYLKTQEVFRDYDYEASDINILLDIHAYNSHKLAFLTNMLLAESFLDSAVLRNSVLSHAKELNYLPRSVRSASAKIRVSFTATTEHAPYVIPKGKPFSTIVKNQSFVFTNPESIIVSSTNSSFSFTTTVYEGQFVQDSYTYQRGVLNQRFKITNKNVDTRSLAVVVFEDNKTVGDLYRYSSTLLDVSATSKVFFLQPNEEGSYEVIFGDGNIGREPKDNAIITLEYRVSSGDIANGAKTFTCDFDPTAYDELTSSITVDLLESASGGGSEETLESIKYYAPRHFQVQERAVTAQDYEIALKTEFPEINAVHAYGGEELTPPQFGRVLISVDVSDVSGLPDSKRKKYYDFIKRRSPFTIEPIFIEPEFSYLSVISKVRFNVNVTALSSENIKTLVINAVSDYRDENLNDFNTILRGSKLAAAIDGADESIVSSLTDIWLYKKLSPTLGTRENHELKFNVALKDDVPEKEKIHDINDVVTLRSSVFQFAGEQCIFEDDGSGLIRIMKIKGSNYEMIDTVGSLDYETGLVKINNLIIDSFYGDYIKIYVKPKDADIVVSQNTILTIETDEIDIEVEELRL